MTRQRLQNRRYVESFFFDHGSQRYTASIGYYKDGRPAEIFLECGRVGVDVNVAIKETAIAASFALQHGCELQTMREAMPRTSDGKPEGALGALLDVLAKESEGEI